MLDRFGIGCSTSGYTLFYNVREGIGAPRLSYLIKNKLVIAVLYTVQVSVVQSCF